MCKMNINTNQLSEQASTTLIAGSVPSCLRNRNDPQRNRVLDRRVSFPENEQHMVTGFLEPANPWEYADNVNKEDLVAKYTSSCKKHGARPISRIISQLQALDYEQDRNECLDLKGEILGPAACETLEEILKRIQFVTINLEGTNIDDESAVALFDMMEYYESAVRLNITGNHCIAARGWQACSRLIKRTKCLEELDARNTTLNEQFMPILSRALRLSTQLHVLKLENCNLSGRPIVILAAALKLNTGLKELYLGENYLMANDATQLSALLKVNTVLQLLDISNNNIQDEGLGQIVEGLLEQNTVGGGLQVLIMWNNHLSRSCGHHLSRIFTASTSLETVNIGQNVLSNEVLHVNKLALQQNRTLLRLGMQSTHLTCEGAVALAEIIADNRTIQRIDLRDNNLQVGGLMALVLSMRVNQSVTQLDLDDMPRRKHSMGPALDEYMRLVAEIRGHCEANSKNTEKPEEAVEEVVKEETLVPNIDRRSRMGSFATRKISLTCETLARSHAVPTPEPSQQLLAEPKRTGGRLRSPAPSPIPSPVASPSPTRSRFQVSRVSESESPVTPPSTSPNVFFGSNSRFKVTVVDSGTPTNPTTVTTSNNVTVGFETSSTLSPKVSVSPAPSPTPIPAPLLSSIPSLFPTPMPSPMPSPLVSPTPSPTYISPLSTINVGEAHPLLPSPATTNSHKDDLSSSPAEISNHSEPIVVNESEEKEAVVQESDKNKFSDTIAIPVHNLRLESSNSCDRYETIIEEPIPDSSTSSTSTVQSLPEKDSLPVSGNGQCSPRSSVSPPKVCKLRSESEESDLYTNRKLPKATDSLDLSALRVTKQASVLVSEKPSVLASEKPSVPSTRSRKIPAWVQPSAVFSALTQDDGGKTSSGLERLLGLFTNPFSRTKADEEPTQQLERVPEVPEGPTQICDNQVESTCTNANTTLNLTEHLSKMSLFSLSKGMQLKNNDNPNEEFSEIDTNDSIKNSLPNDSEDCGLKSESRSDNCPAGSCPSRNGCELKCDKQDLNIPFLFNNNDGLSDADTGSVKCETWPQGTSMTHLSLIHQTQSQSSPCLTALVFLNSNVATNLAAEIKKISPPASDDTVDSTNNISLAL
uniref:Protein phosphatase 1 regulatory subunit 37 n=1 Tax=Cuerna arida TaxID=1464854 RepID=A0A1B6GJU9_9HEMI